MLASPISHRLPIESRLLAESAQIYHEEILDVVDPRESKLNYEQAKTSRIYPASCSFANHLS